MALRTFTDLQLHLAETGDAAPTCLLVQLFGTGGVHARWSCWSSVPPCASKARLRPSERPACSIHSQAGSLAVMETLLGGYISTLFHLLYRFSPAIRTAFGRSEEHRWIARYGLKEFTLGKDDEPVEDGASQPSPVPQGRAGAAGSRSLDPLPPGRQRRLRGSWTWRRASLHTRSR